jgi:hypothetical protein
MGLFALLGSTLVAIVIVTIVLLPLLLTGVLAWKSFARDNPETLELSGLGIASFLTAGLPFIGVLPYLLVNSRQLSSQPEANRWLSLALRLWGIALVCSVVRAFVPDVAAVILTLMGLLASIGSMGGRIVLGWSSSDALIRETARVTLRVWLVSFVFGILIVALTPHAGNIHDSAPQAVASGLVSLVGMFYVTWLWVKQCLGLLVVATRAMPGSRGNLWWKLSLWGMATTAVIGVTLVHRIESPSAPRPLSGTGNSKARQPCRAFSFFVFEKPEESGPPVAFRPRDREGERQFTRTRFL